MQFHRVPRSYQSAVSDVVADLMLATPDSWQLMTRYQLPQPLFAIAEPVNATEGTAH